MDILIGLVLVTAVATAGFSAGVILAEWRKRGEAMAELREARFEMRETLQKVNAAHNSLATQFGQMQDMVNTHEFRISATAKPKGA